MYRQSDLTVAHVVQLELLDLVHELTTGAVFADMPSYIYD
jgi:hypothetical protein